MTDTSAKLKQMVGSQADPQIFQDITTGLATAQTNQQKMNVINHFGKQLQNQVLPLLSKEPQSVASGATSAVSDPQKDPTITASAQPGHPILSINGSFTTDPRKTMISGNSETPQPMTP